MTVHECVSFLLTDDSSMLLEKRKEDKATDPGTINIPGGHIEQGESHVDALYRELDEELGVIPLKYHFLCSLYHPTTELQLIHYYVVSEWQGDLVALEAEQVTWHRIDLDNPVEIASDKLAVLEYIRMKNSGVL